MSELPVDCACINPVVVYVAAKRRTVAANELLPVTWSDVLSAVDS